MLMPFDLNLEIIFECDISNYGVGSVMVHILPDGSDDTERLVAFALRTLNKYERNCVRAEKEV